MINLQVIAKMLGINVDPQVIAQIEAMLPQIPGKVNEIIGIVNMALSNFDGRLKNLDNSQIELHRKLDILLNGEWHDVNTTHPARIAAGGNTNGNDGSSTNAGAGAD